MKKALWITAGVIGFLFLVLLSAPFLFKDQINAKVKEEINKTLNAQVEYKDYSLSFFSDFPRLSFGVDQISVVSTVPAFKGDTLFKADRFLITVDIMSVISGDQIRVNGLYLVKPFILTVYDKEGNFSWDITKPSADTTTAAADTSASKFSLKVDHWEISDAWIIYNDATMPMYAELKGFTHKGKGDITQSIYDLKTTTNIDEMTVTYDGTTYFNKYKFSADMDLNIDNDKSVYKFLENKFKLNNFAFGFNGSIAMPGDDINMDITYKATETDFKNLISLVPAIFTKDYENIKTEGQIGFDGYVKGTYNDKSLPGFGLNLKVDKAMMQYPNLTPVKNIAVDLMVDCKDGVIDHTIVNLKKFHMDMGNNPIDARALVNGLNPYDIDANIKAKLNLADLSTIYPMDGLTLKGLFALDVNAKGKYSDSLKLMPVVNAFMTLDNGYVKSKDFSEPLENLNMKASVISSGDLVNTTVLLEKFTMLLQGEPFEISAKVVNLDNPNYDVIIKGILNLTKLTKIYPLDDMTLAGIIKADINTKGVMSDVMEGNYGKTSTSGTMEMSDFLYATSGMPDTKITKASMSFTPEKINIASMEGFLGKSDFTMNGVMSNYMGYTFGGKDTIIHGNMNMTSKKFDVNEWMAEDTTATATAADAATVEEGVYPIPGNLDFTLNTVMSSVLYDNMTLTDMTGTVLMKDSYMKILNGKFKTLGGDFATSMTYNTQDIKHPWFDFNLNMTDVLIKDAFKTFNTVAKLAPMAENMDGTFSLTNFYLKSEMDKEYMPVYETMSGKGTALIKQATIKDNKALAGIASITKMNGLNPATLKDTKINFKIENGNLVVDPFDTNLGSTKITVNGTNSFGGHMDYNVKMTVPAKDAGNTFAAITGVAYTPSKDLIMDLGVAGDVSDPKVGLKKSNAKEIASDVVKDQLLNSPQAQQVQQQMDQTKQQVQQTAAVAKDSINNTVKATKDTLSNQVKDQTKAAKDSLLKGGKLPPVTKPKLPFGK